MKKIAVIIVNYNGWKDTIECVESLSQTISQTTEISCIVVENGSTDNSTEQLLTRFSKIKQSEYFSIKFIKEKDNTGFSGGNNIGIEYAFKDNADFIMLLNNDTVVDKNFITQLIKIFEEKKHVGAVSPKIYFYPGFEFHKERYVKKDLGSVIWYAGGVMDWKNLIGFHRGVDEIDKGQFDRTEMTEFPTGACVMFTALLLKKVGMLDDKYFLYYEDSDLAMRIKKAGKSIWFVPGSKVWHKNAGSSGSGSPLHDYYITRNRLLFGMRWAPARTKIALIRESIRLLRKGRKWQKIGVKDYFMRRFGKGSYFSVSGE